MLNLKTREEKESLKDFLFRTISDFNFDFTGENGEEYTSEKALDNGYENDFDYYFDHYKKYHKNEESLTRAILDEATNGAYHSFYETASKGNEVIAIASYVVWN